VVASVLPMPLASRTIVRHLAPALAVDKQSKRIALYLKKMLAPIPEHEEHDLESGLLRENKKEERWIKIYVGMSVLCMIGLLVGVIVGFVLL
jgi:hypothetical protein